MDLLDFIIMPGSVLESLAYSKKGRRLEKGPLRELSVRVIAITAPVFHLYEAFSTFLITTVALVVSFFTKVSKENIRAGYKGSLKSLVFSICSIIEMIPKLYDVNWDLNLDTAGQKNRYDLIPYQK